MAYSWSVSHKAHEGHERELKALKILTKQLQENKDIEAATIEKAIRIFNNRMKTIANANISGCRQTI